ncbi:MAG: nucleoside hydrolase [Phycisphaerae bacterium]|nr:nucleoside hydrolase [Phycisphaerae bacterium]
MPRPVLIDTDMGVDDAVALSLAVCAETLDLRWIATVGGNVSAAQAAENVGRCLAALQPDRMPDVACGFDPAADEGPVAEAVFGADGLGEVDLPVLSGWVPRAGLALYEEAARGDERLIVVTLGPLTNLARLLKAKGAPLTQIERIVIMAGAVFAPGNVTPKVEFNIHRDPEAAAAVLDSGLPITLVPLDATRNVVFDESHVAHLAASNTRPGQMLARMIEYPLARQNDAPPGQFLVHDAVAMAVLLWPELFLQTQMALRVVTEGPDRGRTAPATGRKDTPRVSVILSVQVAELLENMLTLLCHEKFVV